MASLEAEGIRVLYHATYGRRGFTSLRRTWNRYDRFLAALPQTPLKPLIPFAESPAATENDILTVHSTAYLDHIQQLDLSGEGKLDGSTPAWRGMYERAARVVGGSLLGADLLIAGYADHVFNPAGGQHHAHQDRGGGFCVFNDVAAAVRRFQQHGWHPAVLDVDGHHGDGTESILYDEPVLTVSLHQYGERTYPGTGAVADTGRGSGLGFAMNIPMPRGTGGAAVRHILESAVEPLLRRAEPDVLILQYGTDMLASDPLLKLRLSVADYAWIAHWAHALSHDLCHGRLLIVGGGGYNPEYVVRCWLLMLADLAGLDPVQIPRAPEWLAEPAPSSDPEADRAARRAAVEAQGLVFPLWSMNTAFYAP